MKTYIAPEIIEIEVNASELMQTSPTIKLGDGDVTDPNEMAAPSYRNSLWND